MCTKVDENLTDSDRVNITSMLCNGLSTLETVIFIDVRKLKDEMMTHGTILDAAGVLKRGKTARCETPLAKF